MHKRLSRPRSLIPLCRISHATTITNKHSTEIKPTEAEEAKAEPEAEADVEAEAEEEKSSPAKTTAKPAKIAETALVTTCSNPTQTKLLLGVLLSRCSDKVCFCFCVYLSICLSV